METGRKVAFTTLGCKVNQYDTESMLTLFRRDGYQVVDWDDAADVYVINTCTVTGRAAAKSRQWIRNAIRRSPCSVVAVTGCYTQTNPDQVEAIPGVNLIIGNQDRHRIVELCTAAMQAAAPVRSVSSIWRSREFEDLPIETFSGKSRAVVKIQEGCNIFCTFCIIPFARGRPRSRQPESIWAEAEQLVSQGYREVVLTGIHLGSYGKDLTGPRLEDVIEGLAALAGLDRIRLSSLEPGHVSDRLIDLLAGEPKLCQHLHLSLQSGSQGVLARMKRAYTAQQYRERVERIHARVPDIGLTTDVIAGFPGETVAEHVESLVFIREMGFSRIHVFPFSPRPDTPAATFPDQVTRPVKEARVHELMALGDELMGKFQERFVGQTLLVLTESVADLEPGWLEGYTSNYLRVRFPAGDELRNTLIPVQLQQAVGETCLGEMAGMPIGRR